MNNKSKQNDYQSYIADEKVSAARILCVLGSMLYAVFSIVDYFSLSVALVEVLSIRGLVVMVMLSMLALSYSDAFGKYYELVISIVCIVSAAGIEVMIYLALPQDHAFDVYFAGLILIIMTVFAWSYLRKITSVLITVSIICGYSYIGFLKGMSITAIMVNDFFLVSAASIGFISQLIRDQFIRENFILQQSLAKIVKEKTLEAKDNEYLANHDPLTDLSNRRHVTELLEKSLQIAKENDKVLALLFLDLNGFKKVNDEHGHTVGDAVLVIVARRLELAIRTGDHLARLGGDEYLVSLMMDKSSLAEIKKMAVKFSAIISKPMIVDGAKITIGVSIGISAYPMHGNKISVLLDIADKKMYGVKQGLQNITRDCKDQYQTTVIELPIKYKQV